MPGPPPKRADQRRRQNKPVAPINSAPGARTVPIPRADAKWHPVARRWYQSLRGSGQAAFYEPSDWATAWVIAESMSRELKPQLVGWTKGEEKGERVPVFETCPPKGASIAAWLKAMTSLMVTEGDRRRLHLELERGGGAEAVDVAGVAHLDDFRRRAQQPG